MSWWSLFGYTDQPESQPAECQPSCQPVDVTFEITANPIIFGRKARVMEELLDHDKVVYVKRGFVSRVRSLLDKMDCTRGRENKIPLAYEIFDYLVANRMIFWKLGYTVFPKVVFLKIYDLQKDGMDLTVHFRKLFPGAPPLEEYASYSDQFIPNVKHFE